LHSLWQAAGQGLALGDGDNGRDWSRPARPLSADGATLIKPLEVIGVRGFVLQQYGLENYFSKAAVQAVLGLAVAQYFLWPTMPRPTEVPGYSKAAMVKSPRQ